MTTVLERDPVLAPAAEASAIRQLEAFLERATEPTARLTGPNGEQMQLPVSVYQLLVRLVRDLAGGAAVTIVPIHAEVTTQQAADLLNISRPYLIKLLEEQQIPYHYVGTHRRIRFQDLMEYRHRRDQARRAAIVELAQEAQEMGLYE